MSDVTVGKIYNFIDSFAPFSLQQSYDNSGICVGSRNMPVTRILTALDITRDVVLEAEEKGCELVISHHPVIFRGLKTLDPDHPAVMLAARGIAAICAHTSFDSAEGGMNDLLALKLGLKIIEPLSFDEGKPMGYVCEMPFECSEEHLAGVCKRALGCRAVRYTKTGKSIIRVGLCSGSGADLIFEAVEKGCQALITGDVKHNFFIDADNLGFCLIDAGHFYTENIFHDFIKEKIEGDFAGVTVTKSERFDDPVLVM